MGPTISNFCLLQPAFSCLYSTPAEILKLKLHMHKNYLYLVAHFLPSLVLTQLSGNETLFCCTSLEEVFIVTNGYTQPCLIQTELLRG